MPLRYTEPDCMDKWLLLLCLVSLLRAADKPWTWKDKDGHIRTRAELHALVQENAEFVEFVDVRWPKITRAYVQGERTAESPEHG